MDSYFEKMSWHFYGMKIRLSDLANDIDTIHNDMTHTLTVSVLLDSLRSQAVEMTTMQQELDRFESDLDDLITNLTRLDSETVRCSHNWDE